MNIISCDPGLSAGTNTKPHGTGIAVFDNNAITKTFFIRGLSPDHTFKQRMEEIVETINATIPDWARYQFVVERSGYQQNINVAYLCYGLFGVLDYIFGPVEFISPTTVKKLVTGSGKAEKKDMKQFLQQIYAHQEHFSKVHWDNEDVVDALGIGYAFIKQQGGK